ncbi:MAG: 23S rRNA (adenine(2503)-C(2))-methyltransferase RlmN [Thermodesulfobacteriota bacterium]
MTAAPSVNLKDLSPEELAGFFEALGQKPFRARQVLGWLYRSRCASFGDMTDLAKGLRTELEKKARLSRPRLAEEAVAEDGTRKFLWALEDGSGVESVLIPERDHLTLCLSSQVGCAMGCRFCRTAGLGLKRNLTQAEILDQVLGALDRAGPEARLTNIVFMGMGEPLANRENVIRALRIIIAPGLLGFSRRRLSVSTVGLVPELPRLAEAGDVGLTVSLNAADDRTRGRLMPINRRYNLAALHRALAAHPLPRGRRITIAYVLLAGVNDSEEDARKLVHYLHGLKVKVNLIPFNPYPGAEFEPPDEKTVQDFLEVLVERKYTAIVRKSKGRDIAAACGQLAGEARGDSSST